MEVKRSEKQEGSEKEQVIVKGKRDRAVKSRYNKYI